MKFFLHKDVKFRDGRPLKADAVVFTFERLRKIGKGPWDAFPTLKSVNALDDYTVLFTVSKPFAPFLSTLAINGASIINPNVMKFEKGPLHPPLTKESPPPSPGQHQRLYL